MSSFATLAEYDREFRRTTFTERELEEIRSWGFCFRTPKWDTADEEGYEWAVVQSVDANGNVLDTQDFYHPEALRDAVSYMDARIEMITIPFEERMEREFEREQWMRKVDGGW